MGYRKTFLLFEIYSIQYPIQLFCLVYILLTNVSKIQYVRKKSTPYNSLVSNRVIKTDDEIDNNN